MSQLISESRESRALLHLRISSLELRLLLGLLEVMKTFLLTLAALLLLSQVVPGNPHFSGESRGGEWVFTSRFGGGTDYSNNQVVHDSKTTSAIVKCRKKQPEMRWPRS